MRDGMCSPNNARGGYHHGINGVGSALSIRTGQLNASEPIDELNSNRSTD
jgi:hypothetical protein